MPGRSFYYSYNYGGAHIVRLQPVVLAAPPPPLHWQPLIMLCDPQIVMSQYVWPNYKYDSPMYAWMAKDLAAVDRTVTPWVIVQFHKWAPAPLLHLAMPAA